MNHPNYEQCLTALCGDNDHTHFSEEDIASVQPFRAWPRLQLGQHLLALEVITDDNGTYLRWRSTTSSRHRDCWKFKNLNNQIHKWMRNIMSNETKTEQEQLEQVEQPVKLVRSMMIKPFLHPESASARPRRKPDYHIPKEAYPISS